MTLRLISKTYWRGTWIRFREKADFAVPEVATVYAQDGAQLRGVARVTPRVQLRVVDLADREHQPPPGRPKAAAPPWGAAHHTQCGSVGANISGFRS